MAEPRLIPELYVSSIKQSLAFYTNILGFEILYQRAEEHFAMLEREGAQIMIEQHGIGRNWLTDILEKPYGRGVNFQIQANDIMSLHEKIQKANACIFLPLEEKWYKTDQGHAGNKQFIVQDPDGYLLRFFEDLGTQNKIRTA